MNLLVSAGGTGGGIYPALAVVATIQTISPETRLLFVGSRDGLENTLIQETGTQFHAYATVRAGPLHGVGVLRMLHSSIQLTLGTLQALRIFWGWRPRVVFLTGGWVGLPVALAALLFRVPILIFVPDIEPGLTLKVLGRFAQVITATTADTQAFFPHKKVIATGYPLRPDLMAATRAAGQQRFKLDPHLPTLLVFGGSRGARSLNAALLECATPLLSETPLQMIHVTGRLDWDEVRQKHAQLDPTIQKHYQIFEYLHDLGLAMAAADVVLSRGGASTLGEFPYFHLPSILVPYPHAWRYQKVNADWLVSRGAALRLDDERLKEDLLPMLSGLFSDPAQLDKMRAAAKTLARADGAENVARALLNLKQKKGEA